MLLTSLPMFALFASLIASLVTFSGAIPLVKPFKVCDTKAKGPLLKLQQDVAILDFARLYITERKPREAFDKYIPGDYIQHNPNSLSGRDPAIEFLITLQATPGMIYSNVTAFAGSGFGLIHFRRRVPNTEVDFAIMDRFRFQGTCIVEHWDVRERIYGNETNPIAYF